MTGASIQFIYPFFITTEELCTVRFLGLLHEKERNKLQGITSLCTFRYYPALYLYCLIYS